MLVKKSYKALASMSAAMLLTLNFCVSTYAADTYDNYEYTADNYNGLILDPATQSNPLLAPDAMAEERILNHLSLDTQQLVNPSDFCFDSEGQMYILDSGTVGNGNGRILVINRDLKTIRYISTGFDFDGKFVDFFDANGIYVDINGLIYVTFMNKAQVAVLRTEETGGEYKLLPVKMISAPDVSRVQENFVFKPIKIVADVSGKMFIANQGSFNGLISLDSDGGFTGFIGANKVVINAWDYFWKSIATSSQKEARLDYIPIEFSSVEIDDDGFFYVTVRGNQSDINRTQAIIESKVRKMNRSGDDILYQTSNLILGDRTPNIIHGQIGSESSFVDVCAGDYGVFFCLDSTRGRVFAYDDSSKQLFVVGSLANQAGCFKNPVAVEWYNGKLYVLDMGLGQITEFRQTVYGRHLLDGIMYRSQTEYEKSYESFRKVLEINANNETALIGVGKSLYSKGEYKEAMQAFLLGGDKTAYSKAFERYRTQVIRRVVTVAGPILIAVIVLFIAYQLFLFMKRSKNRFQFFMEQSRIYHQNRNKR